MLYPNTPDPDATRTITAFRLGKERYTVEQYPDGDVVLTSALHTQEALPADTFIIPARAVRLIEIALRHARQPMRVVRAEGNVVFLGGKP